MKTRISIIIAALFAAFLTTSYAGPTGTPGWPNGYPSYVTTTKEAEDCCKEAGAKVALACKDCKTVNEKGGEDKKGILGWFKADSMHDCSGCKGKITVGPPAKGGRAAEYTHTCSKCGANSAYVCSTHKK